ncbi:ATP-binding protein [Mucilaginibacter ximonensis]|uniref:histidine kinase n=1 Tax=Mucilaginibacter ximonensis TaxID=538021 RepID=A0ABW5YB57_9SPHI
MRAHVDTLFGTNRVNEGMRELEAFVNNAKDLTLEDKYATYGYRYFYYHRALGDHKKALLYADTMLSIANEVVGNQQQYEHLYIDAQMALGDTYFNLGNYSAAYQHLFQGYLVGKNGLNRSALSEYMYRMGMITYKMGNYKLAKDYFMRSYMYYTIVPSDFVNYYHVQELLDNIALSYKHNDQLDSAVFYFDKSLAFINKYGPQFKDRLKMMEIAQGVVYGNKAEIYILQKKYQQAIVLLKKSIDINLKKDYDNADAELSEIKLAQIYDQFKRDTELYGLLTALGQQLKTIKNPDVEADWNHLMSNYYERRGDLAKAINHLKTYNTLKDSNLARYTVLKESDIDKQFDTYEKQQQINELSNNNKIQRILLVVILVFATMSLIIIFLVYRNWRRSKKDVQTVKLLNQQINEQNAELGKALNELKISSQEKDRILRTVAHDLRNPIGGIASLTTMMADDGYTDEQKELINLVKETSHNSLELINEILEATNVTSIEIHPELVEINALTSTCVELLRFKAAEKAQKIFFEPLDSPQQLMISREKIWRVINNLITNAIKFSPTGAPIFVKIVKEKGEVVISVLDNGIGIPDKLKDDVFNMFTKAQRPGTSGEKSFGLGLSICKQIIEKSHGKIWFESSNRGTIFYISLPMPGKDGLDKLPQQFSVPQS